MTRPTALVVMGVSGAGKSTIAQLLADRLGWTMAEADLLHPQANIDKMAAGTPLTDADRLPWLARIRDWISEHAAAGRPVVVSCSALKRSYRDLLREGAPGVHFLHMHGPEEVIWERIAARADHFMPPALLRSQLETLQPLDPDEAGREFDVRSDVDALARSGVAAPP
jgi:gluconokinase